jgi:hypothetical protein
VASTATHNPAEKLSMFVLAAVVLSAAIGSAFAFGWLVGRILL